MPFQMRKSYLLELNGHISVRMTEKFSGTEIFEADTHVFYAA